MVRRLVLPGLLAVLTALLALGCSHQTVEDRARSEAEKLQKELADYDAPALEQKVDPAVVSDVQRQLTAVKEYQGEITGQIDGVTLNAIQAFQRTAGISDDGILNEQTRSKLAAAAQPAAAAQ